MSLSRAMSFFTQSIMARSQMTFCDVAFSPHQKQLPKNQCKWTRRRHQLNKSIEKRKKKPRLPHALGTSIFFTRLQNNDRPPCCFSLPSPSVPSLFCYWLSWWIVDSKFVFDLLLFWSVLTARLILVSYYFAVGWLLRRIFLFCIAFISVAIILILDSFSFASRHCRCCVSHYFYDCLWFDCCVYHSTPICVRFFIFSVVGGWDQMRDFIRRRVRGRTFDDLLRACCLPCPEEWVTMHVLFVNQ